MKDPTQTTEEEDRVDTWQDQPGIIPIVSLLKRQMPLKMQTWVDEQDCFGWLWVEEDGSPCPEADECRLATMCKQSWQMWQVQRGDGAKMPVPEPTELDPMLTAVSGKDLAEARAKRANRQVNRGRWKGTDKFKRHGYQPRGTVVDDLLVAFLEGAGNPRAFPANSKVKNFHSPYAAVRATASYHAIHQDGVVWARFWTNALHVACIDIVPELVPSVKLYAHELQTGQRPLITMPEKAKDSVWMKVRPCTHHVRVRDEVVTRGLGEVVRQKLRFE